MKPREIVSLPNVDLVAFGELIRLSGKGLRTSFQELRTSAEAFLGLADNHMFVDFTNAHGLAGDPAGVDPNKVDGRRFFLVQGSTHRAEAVLEKVDDLGSAPCARFALALVKRDRIGGA